MIPVERILVTRLRFLGDIVLCTPLLDALREALPQARIEFLGLHPHVDVLQRHPSVDGLHVLPAGAKPPRMLALVRDLRRRRFDAMVDLFGNPRSALITRGTGAPLRIGNDRGLRARLFTHRRGRPAGDRSAIRHHLDKLVPLLGAAPAPRPTSLSVGEDERGALRARLGLERDTRLRIVHPGSTWPDKAWPEQRWRELVATLDREGEQPLVVIQPPGMGGLAARVAAGTRARALPELNVREVLALLTHGDLYVGHDGGILHAAVALRVPSVGVFGPTEPDIWFPYEDLGPYRVIHRCDPPRLDAKGQPASRLTSIAVDEVVATIAAVDRLRREGAPR